MKIISIKSKPKFKTVNFHGVEFDNVPENARYIAADADGEVYAYQDKKIPPSSSSFWKDWNSSKGTCRYLGEVDLEGMYWSYTLVKI